MTGAPLRRRRSRGAVESCRGRGGGELLRDVRPAPTSGGAAIIARARSSLRARCSPPGALALAATMATPSARSPGPRVAITTGDEVVAAEAAPGQDSCAIRTPTSCSPPAVRSHRGRGVGVATRSSQELGGLPSARCADVALIRRRPIGAHDLVESALARLGCEVLCDGVAMQPGNRWFSPRTPAGWCSPCPEISLCHGRFRLRASAAADAGPRVASGRALAGTLTERCPRPAATDSCPPRCVSTTATGGRPTAARLARPRRLARGTALVRVRARTGPRAGQALRILPLVSWVG
jgi:hypothetical protein